MNIYLVKRNDNPWYDETHAMVIEAKSIEEAEVFSVEEINEHDYLYRDKKISAADIDIYLIGTAIDDFEYASAYLILRDFHAG